MGRRVSIPTRTARSRTFVLSALPINGPASRTSAIDQHLLPALEMSLVPDALQSDGSRLRQRRGLFIAHAGRQWRQDALRNAHVLREPAHLAQDVAERILAQPEQRRMATYHLHPPGDV